MSSNHRDERLLNIGEMSPFHKVYRKSLGVMPCPLYEDSNPLNPLRVCGSKNRVNLAPLTMLIEATDPKRASVCHIREKQVQFLRSIQQN